MSLSGQKSSLPPLGVEIKFSDRVYWRVRRKNLGSSPDGIRAITKFDPKRMALSRLTRKIYF